MLYTPNARSARSPLSFAGNPVLEDIGVWLKDRIIAHFKKAGKPLNLKYIGAWRRRWLLPLWA
jgi:hypothetical protein